MLCETSVMTANTTPARRATSSDVARRAGLSRTTVSQILNGNVAQFPQETRDRVAAAAAELHYRPSRAGRALVTGVSDMVVIAVPSVTFGVHLQDAVDQITNASATLGMSVVVRFAGNDSAATLTSVLDLRPMVVVDFGVFSPEDRRTITASGSTLVPHVPNDGEAFVDELDIYVGRLQAREVLRRGDRTVIFAQLEDARTAPYGATRLLGVAKELSERGLPAPHVIHTPLRAEAATAALQEVLSGRDEASAVCCYNDDVAIAVLAGLRALGRSVPDEVSVIGVDHTEIGQMVLPRLASIHIDLTGMINTFLEELVAIRQSEKTRQGVTKGSDPHLFVNVVHGDSC